MNITLVVQLELDICSGMMRFWILLLTPHKSWAASNLSNQQSDPPCNLFSFPNFYSYVPRKNLVLVLLSDALQIFLSTLSLSPALPLFIYHGSWRSVPFQSKLENKFWACLGQGIAKLLFPLVEIRRRQFSLVFSSSSSSSVALSFTDFTKKDFVFFFGRR